MKWIIALLAIVGLAGVAHAADSGAAAADPYALYYPLIATGLGSLGAFVRSYTPADGFWHKWYGHALLVLIGALAGSLTPTFEAGHVTKLALISACVGGCVTFLSALKPSGQAAAASLLPLLIIVGLASGCAGYKSPSYATLTTMSSAVGQAAEQLPPICEGRETAAVDSAASKDDAIAKSGAVHAQCKTALASLTGINAGIVSARDAIHDAPTGADLSAVTPWLKLALKQYCDAVPLLAVFGKTLPTFPGVC